MQQMINKSCVLLGKKFGSFDRGLRPIGTIELLFNSGDLSLYKYWVHACDSEMM